jgi:RNA 3'-terminal phosphate cyclase (ATP)
LSKPTYQNDNIASYTFGQERMERAQAAQTVYIDGSLGEGGGQILRTSVSLAAITERPVEIANIRARRSKPGLQAQHLASVRAAAALCNAQLHGATLGSQYLHFVPQPFTEQNAFAFEVGTAGATGLVAQTLLVPMALLPTRPASATLQGGTHVPMAPPADYIEAVYLPMLQRLGLEARLQCDRAGFFPKGGGTVHLQVEGGALTHPIDLTKRGKLMRFRLFIVTAQLPEHVAERGKQTLLKDLRGYGVPVECTLRNLPSIGAGAAITLVAECQNGMGGFTALGERGKPMERVVLEAVRDFEKWFASGTGMDAHLADQLALPCALIPHTSRWSTPEVTDHLRTVLHVVQQFLPISYRIVEHPDGSGNVEINGVAPSGEFGNS